MLCDTVYRFRCDEQRVVPEYLELALNSPSVVSELDKKKSGISDSGISLNHGKVKSTQIMLPNELTDQKNIVDTVSAKMDAISVTNIEIEANFLRTELLRQSILKKAFSGQLVEQDPNDEPASVLLDRIRTEKARHKPKPSKKEARRKVATG